MSSREKFYRRKSHGVIIIAPRERHTKKVSRALNFLKRVDIKNFGKVTRNFDTILVTPFKGYHNTLFVRERLWMTCRNVLEKEDYPYQYLASLLIHEAQHIVQAKSGRTTTGYKAEKEAYLVQRKFLQRISYDNAVVWLDKLFRRKWWVEFEKKKGVRLRFKKLLEDYKKGKLILQ